MSAEDPFTVVIVGAGLGGLCLANGLVNGVRDEAVDGDRASAEQLVAPPNVRVIVLERDASANDREQGYYIGIQKMGLDALEDVGVLDDVMGSAKRSSSTPVQPFSFATPQGDLLMSMTPPDDPKHDFAAIPMHRQRMRDVLLSQVDGCVQFGAQVTGLEQSGGDSVTVILQDGSKVHADVVVAADGSRSAVRKLLNLPHDEPNDVGLRILGGTVTDAGQLDSFPKGAGSLMIMGRGSSLFVGRYSADGDDGVEGEATGEQVINWGLAVRYPIVPMDKWLSKRLKDDKATHEGHRADLLPLLRNEGWHESLLNLVADTPTSRLRIRDLFDRHPFVKTGGASEVSHRWPAGRVTLLGDAAHPMLPYQGAGGNCALQDGASLARHLVKVASVSAAEGAAARTKLAAARAVPSTPRIKAALQQYEHDMFARSSTLVMRSRQAATYMHTTSPVGVAVRNTVAKGFGLLMRVMRR